MSRKREILKKVFDILQSTQVDLYVAFLGLLGSVGTSIFKSDS